MSIPRHMRLRPSILFNTRHRRLCIDVSPSTAAHLMGFRAVCDINWFHCHHTEGWSKSSFLFLIQRKGRILSKFYDVHNEIRYISTNWVLFEKQLWRDSLWHVTSRDIPKGVIVVNRFSRVASVKFEIFVRNKKHSIPIRNAHPTLIATGPKTI